MKLNPHEVKFNTEDDSDRATIHPASQHSVEYVLSKSVDDPDGRSQFVWVRLPNGDLILGVYPQGETYEFVEEDAYYPPLFPKHG